MTATQQSDRGPYLAFAEFEHQVYEVVVLKAVVVLDDIFMDHRLVDLDLCKELYINKSRGYTVVSECVLLNVIADTKVFHDFHSLAFCLVLCVSSSDFWMTLAAYRSFF